MNRIFVIPETHSLFLERLLRIEGIVFQVRDRVCGRTEVCLRVEEPVDDGRRPVPSTDGEREWL